MAASCLCEFQDQGSGVHDDTVVPGTGVGDYTVGLSVTGLGFSLLPAPKAALLTLSLETPFPMILHW